MMFTSILMIALAAAPTDDSVAALLPHLSAVADALAADHVRGVAEAAAAVCKGLEGLAGTTPQGLDVAEAKGGCKSLGTAKDIKAARAAFGQLSQAVAPWAGRVRPKGYDLVWCPMVPGGWVQKAGPVKNPYFGASMLACGTKQ